MLPGSIELQHSIKMCDMRMGSTQLKNFRAEIKMLKWNKTLVKKSYRIFGWNVSDISKNGQSFHNWVN